MPSVALLRALSDEAKAFLAMAGSTGAMAEAKEYPTWTFSEQSWTAPRIATFCLSYAHRRAPLGVGRGALIGKDEACGGWQGCCSTLTLKCMLPERRILVQSTHRNLDAMIARTFPRLLQMCFVFVLVDSQCLSREQKVCGVENCSVCSPPSLWGC